MRGMSMPRIVDVKSRMADAAAAEFEPIETVLLAAPTTLPDTPKPPVTTTAPVVEDVDAVAFEKVLTPVNVCGFADNTASPLDDAPPASTTQVPADVLMFVTMKFAPVLADTVETSPSPCALTVTVPLDLLMMRK